MVENGERYIKATKELMFAWAFRGLLAIVSGLGFWTLQRITSVEDDISRAVHSHDLSLQGLKDDTAEIKWLARDHETRIRTLEHSNPQNSPPH